jgi:hypothetical protein
VSFRGIETASRSSLYLSARGEGESKPLHPAILYKSSSALDRWEHLRIVILPCGANHSVGDIITAEVKLMVKYALLSLGVAGLLVLGEGLAPQVTWPTGQQERFVVRVPEDFPTIQAAIDAVAEGGTVLIGPGTYQENLKITKSLRLIGAGQGIVKIQPKDDPFGPPPLYSGQPAIEITTKGEEKFIQIYLARLSLEGLKEGEVRNGIGLGITQAVVEDVDISGYYYGLIGGENVILSRVSVHHNGTGVWSGKSLTVRNSLFHDNVVGIKSFGGNLEVRQSVFARNSAAIAIWDVWSSREKELMGNAITGNDVGLYLALGPTSDIQEKLKAANQPELGPSLMTMIDNEIVGNREYGIALAHSECMEGQVEAAIFYPFSLIWTNQKVLIAFWEKNNTIRNNGKGDLCPADYPWPPGFRK